MSPWIAETDADQLYCPVDKQRVHAPSGHAPTTDSQLRSTTDSSAAEDYHSLPGVARQSVSQSTTQLPATKRRCRPLVQTRIHERGRPPCHAHKMSASLADYGDVTAISHERQYVCTVRRPNREWRPVGLTQARSSSKSSRVIGWESMSVGSNIWTGVSTTVWTLTNFLISG